MTERERLIEILQNVPADLEGNRGVGMIADYLLESGVIVPPVKVGDTVYEIRQKGKNYKGRKYDNGVTTQKRMKYPPICGATLYVKEKPFVKSDFCRLGGTIFLTREAAEKALAERRGEL